MSTFNTVEEIIQELKAGHFVILVDDENRENEGDLMIASDCISPEAVNFMTKEARGLICVSIESAQAKKLELSLMVKEEDNISPHKTAFTVSVEAAKGVSTGISAQDRSQTIKVVSNPQSSKQDIISPGHIFPIRAQKGGVLKRAGHTEASVDFCKLAGLNPSAVICEIINSNGTMSRAPELFKFAKKHDIKIGTIEDLIKYRMSHDSLVEQKLVTPFNTGLGPDWKAHVFYDEINDREHLALTKGVIKPENSILVRVQTDCITGDLFQDSFLQTGSYLQKSLELINQEGAGVFVYLRMQNSISKYIEHHQAQIEKYDVNRRVTSDNKDYGIGAQILRALGISKIRLITNSKNKKIGLGGYGLSVEKVIPIKTDKKDNKSKTDKTSKSFKAGL